MTTFKTLDDINVVNKRCLVRVDINVPMADGKVTDKTRIERVKPTIDYISKNGGKVILLAHFGRPKGTIVTEMTLEPVAHACAQVFGKTVAFASNCAGDCAVDAISKMADGDILLLENTRFHEGEEKNNPAFAKELANLGDIFVADAFSASHRAHASTVGIADHLPTVAGRTMQAEVEALEAALANPQRPVVALVGGAKVSSKIDLLENLVSRVDSLIIGGGMANTFLAAQGIDVSKSLCEHDLAPTALKILAAADKANCQIILPDDVVVAKEFAANAANETVDAQNVPADTMILDAGPKAVKRVNEVIDSAKTLVWNGPLGAFEMTPFDTATVAAAKHAAKRTKSGDIMSVAGGGDTVAALNHAGVAQDFSYVSTAGGAFLEWLEGKALPGVEILRN
ncbi:MAG: phosphoglycerate kinase [Hyphomicrobiales bacterium]